MKRYLVEFIGTFFLTLAIAFTGNPLAIGAMLVAVMYMVGIHVDGGHYNPAVSFAEWVRSGFKREEYLIFMVMQAIGACVALCLLWRLSGTVWSPGVVADVPWWIVLCTEAIFTFLFCMVFLTMTTLNKLKGAHVYGLAIGSAYMAVLFFGGLYNPAVAFSAGVMSMLKGAAMGGSMVPMVGYLIGPFVGGILAASAFGYLCEK